jgi:putative tricarboxylic transport membrane protein
LYVARAKPRTVIVYGLSLAIVIAALPSVVPIELPIGLVNTTLLSHTQRP